MTGSASQEKNARPPGAGYSSSQTGWVNVRGCRGGAGAGPRFSAGGADAPRTRTPSESRIGLPAGVIRTWKSSPVLCRVSATVRSSRRVRNTVARARARSASNRSRDSFVTASPRSGRRDAALPDSPGWGVGRATSWCLLAYDELPPPGGLRRASGPRPARGRAGPTAGKPTRPSPRFEERTDVPRPVEPDHLPLVGAPVKGDRPDQAGPLVPLQVAVPDERRADAFPGDQFHLPQGLPDPRDRPFPERLQLFQRRLVVHQPFRGQ